MGRRRKHNRRWTREKLIAELQRLDAHGVRLTSPTLQARDPGLYLACRSTFGTFAAALRAAELPPVKHGRAKWSRELVVARLKELDARGVHMIFSEVWREDKPLVNQSLRLFGTFEDAVTAAGLEFEGRRYNKWDRSSIIAELQRLHRDGVPMSYAAITERDRYLAVQARGPFGSLRAAVEAAGLVYLDPERRKWTEDRVKAELRELASRGVPMIMVKVDAEDHQLVKKCYELFGSFPAAVEAAGMAYPRERVLGKWTDESVIKGLQELKAEGIRMSVVRVKNANGPLFYAARDRFGSFDKALESAGLEREWAVRASSSYVGAPRKWDRDKVIEEIRASYERGEDLSYTGVKVRDRPLLSSADNYFGSWRAAVEAAGVDYSKQRRRGVRRKVE